MRQNFIVMARAQQSLQDLVEKAAPLAEPDVLEIIDAIVGGLIEIGELVHRDLKPGNVLLHNGVWKIADLGLARFVEASTSANTMKGFLSAQYAAPEQWRDEHATKATDVYALGCIIYALMTGRPPFTGRTREDYSRLHQFNVPPALKASDRLRSLASACLGKNPLGRPSLSSVTAQARRARQAFGSFSSGSLAAVGATLADDKVRAEAQQALYAKSTKDREALTRDAIRKIRDIFDQLIKMVQIEAPTSEYVRYGDEAAVGMSYDIRLGQAALRAWVFPSLSDYMLRACSEAGWDVLVGVIMWVQSAPFGDGADKKDFSANLWFGKHSPDEGYRWSEVSYTTGTPGEAPFGLDGNQEPAQVQPIRPPRIIDGEHIEEFLIRWSNFLAEAAEQHRSAPPRI